MCGIKKTWTVERLKYQLRYIKAYEKFETCENGNTSDFYTGISEGSMLEISWVLINIFGLTPKQVHEVERNKGFTDEDLESQEIQALFDQANPKKHYGSED